MCGGISWTGKLDSLRMIGRCSMGRARLAAQFCKHSSHTTLSRRYLSRERYHWVYANGENGYDEKAIEDRFSKLSSGGSIDLDIKDQVSVVTINNVPKRNAFSGTMLVELRDIVKQLWDNKSLKAVVLRGAGDAFCSGLDLKLARQLTDPEDGANMCMYMQNTLTLFQLLPSITVAAIKGPALGGGAEVATAADFRIVFPHSSIQFVHKKMGIIPGWGGVTRLRDIVGPRKSMHLLASSESLDAKSTLLIGLADILASDCEDDSDAAEVAAKWLEQTFQLKDTAASVIRAIKCAAYDTVRCQNQPLPLDYKLKRERDILITVWGKTPNRKALNKVMTKT